MTAPTARCALLPTRDRWPVGMGAVRGSPDTSDPDADPRVFLLLPLTAGLGAAIVASQISPLARLVRSRAVVIGGRLALTILAVAMLPGTVSDLRDVVVRDPPAVSPDSGTGR